MQTVACVGPPASGTKTCCCLLQFGAPLGMHSTATLVLQ